jgi:hypothetical protein
MAAAVGNVMERRNFGIFGYLAVSLAVDRKRTQRASLAITGRGHATGSAADPAATPRRPDRGCRR